MQETRETWVQSLGQEDPLEEEMAAQSSILAWRVPWTEVLGGLRSLESQSWTQLGTPTPFSCCVLELIKLPLNQAFIW